MALAVFAALVIIDPFDTLSLSPDLDRAPIDENQRYTYPSLARKARFDSAVIGTSTSRLLKPACLDDAFDARFVNLAMNSSEAWEQVQVLRLFVRHHPEAKVLAMGLDGRWLSEAPSDGSGEPPRTSPHYEFPPWLYDEDPLNDYLHLFDRWTVERARRQLSYLLGISKAKYGKDGYRDFLPDFGAYDAAKVRRLLYGDDKGTIEKVVPAVVLGEEAVEALHFPTHALFQSLLDELPEGLEKVFFFPPYHFTKLGPEGGRQDAVREISKRRIAAMIADAPGARLLDFQLRSRLTRDDGSFWDPVHITDPAAEAVCRALRASRDGPPRSRELYVLRVP